MDKIGLVLSGGGARGLAHLGVLHALEEFGIEYSVISGCSAGAIIAAFYSEGYKSKEILEIARNRNFFGFSHLQFGKAGLFDMNAFIETYKTYISHNRIEQLKIPIFVDATDIIQ